MRSSTKTAHFSMRIEPALLKALEEIATKQERSVAFVVTKILESHVRVQKVQAELVSMANQTIVLKEEN